MVELSDFIISCIVGLLWSEQKVIILNQISNWFLFKGAFTLFLFKCVLKIDHSNVDPFSWLRLVANDELFRDNDRNLSLARLKEHKWYIFDFFRLRRPTSRDFFRFFFRNLTECWKEHNFFFKIFQDTLTRLTKNLFGAIIVNRNLTLRLKKPQIETFLGGQVNFVDFF